MHFDFFLPVFILKKFQISRIKNHNLKFILDLTHEKKPWIDERPLSKEKKSKVVLPVYRKLPSTPPYLV